MLRLCPAILAASCALAQSITVGVLEVSPDPAEGTVLIPAGRYAEGQWTSQGVKNLPGEWRFWNSSNSGSALRLVSPCKVSDCWTTDFSPANLASTNPKIAGVAVSPATPIDPFEVVAQGSDEYNKIESFVSPILKSREEQTIRERGLTPTEEKAGTPQRISRARIGEATYDHVLLTREIYDPKASDHLCKFYQFVFGAWVRESPAGAPALMSDRTQFDDCNGVDLSYLNPAGALVLDGKTFVVGEEFYYEGAAAVVVRLDQASSRIVARHHWTPD